MKSTGLVRKVDPLGRIMLPKSLRELMRINADDTVELLVNGDCIYLRRFDPTCAICGEQGAEYTFKDKGICSHCLSDVKNS